MIHPTDLALAVLLGGAAGGGLWCIASALPSWRAPVLVHRIGPYIRDVTDPRGVSLRSDARGAELTALWAAAQERLTHLAGGSASVDRRLHQAGWAADAAAFRGRQLAWAIGGLAIGGAAVVLLVALLAQAAFAWRVDVVRRIPGAAAAYELLGIEVSLPRDVELISIESSDLQSEPARGLLVLNALLRNRATFAQEWPLLELSLTDTADTVIARRVLAAKDYLPPGADLSAFPPGSEAPVRIWLDAKGLGAGGYRLFVFYP